MVTATVNKKMKKVRAFSVETIERKNDQNGEYYEFPLFEKVTKQKIRTYEWEKPGIEGRGGLFGAIELYEEAYGLNDVNLVTENRLTHELAALTRNRFQSDLQVVVNKVKRKKGKYLKVDGRSLRKFFIKLLEK